jgi:type IV secretory pathway TrbD component
MADPRSKRKRRGAGTGPRAVASTRREQRAAREAQARERRRAGRDLGRVGERPRGLFGAVPVSEVAILAGLVVAVVGLAEHGQVTIVIGLVICALGVVEVTGREHLSGYRSHTVLLAAVPTVILEAVVVAVFGDPSDRAWLLLVMVPVFALLFFVLRQRFRVARQARAARVARAAAPGAG